MNKLTYMSWFTEGTLCVKKIPSNFLFITDNKAENISD